jgi:hypothetical protein
VCMVQGERDHGKTVGLAYSATVERNVPNTQIVSLLRKLSTNRKHVLPHSPRHKLFARAVARFLA